MKSITDTFRLQNGVEIPCIGFGTWQAPDGETAKTAVKEALAAGYRHIDTAAAYGNEESVGAAIRESGIPRNELFITTKLWNAVRGYQETLAAFEDSRKKLGLEMIDLYLIHWPNPLQYRDQWQVMNAGSWKAMEELYHAGKIRAIGVSNFRPHHIEALMETATVMPMVNQIRLCPGDVHEETTAYCRDHEIVLEAYSPLGTGTVFSNQRMKALAEKYGKSIAQICLRWSLENGFLPLPKSVTAERIRENLEVFDFQLTAEDRAEITRLEGCGDSKDPDTTSF